MKLVDLKCPNCSALMKVNSDQKEVACDYCGTKFAVDDEIHHIHYDNAEQAGYEFEKGRQRAQSEQYQSFATNNVSFQSVPVKAKKNRIWLWVIGWILMFPLPLTILMIRNKKLNKWLRIGIIVIAWIAYIAIGLSGQSNSNSTQSVDNNSAGTTVNEQQKTTVDARQQIDVFVDHFNGKSNVDLVFNEEFAVQDKSSGHYRTEFRLDTYKDAVGKSFKYNNISIDLISRQPLTGDSILRMYAVGASLEECNAIIEAAANFFDPQLTQKQITEITDYITENKSANGNYKGNLGILLRGNENSGYNLMIKCSND